MYKIVITRFLIYNNSDKIRFLKKTFLLAKTSVEQVLKMFFLVLKTLLKNFIVQLRPYL